MPLFDKVGNCGTAAPLHIAVGNGLKMGAEPDVMVTIMGTRTLSHPFTI
jgi:hypothetical protein